MDIKEIFSFPTKDKDWAVKMIIGIALSIIPIVNFFCSGYAYRIFKPAVLGGPLEMPEWDGWGDLFVRGFLIFVISLIYMLIPLILVGAGAGLLVYLYYLRGWQWLIHSGGGMVGLALIIAGIVLYIVAVVMLPMALAVYAKNDERFGAAFRLWEIIPNIFRVFEDYLIAVVLIVCVFFAFIVLCIIPYLGILFAVAFSFYLKYLLEYALFGSACSGAFVKRGDE